MSSEALETAFSVAIGSDHGGYELKSKVIGWLQLMGCEVADLGTHSTESCDYPKIAFKVAEAVGSGDFDRGILICRSGIGMAICANKVHGVRAGICRDRTDAESSREHNDTNVLVLGADRVSDASAKTITRTWLETAFDLESRHARRVRQIIGFEKDISARKEENEGSV